MPQIPGVTTWQVQNEFYIINDHNVQFCFCHTCIMSLLKCCLKLNNKFKLVFR